VQTAGPFFIVIFSTFRLPSSFFFRLSSFFFLLSPMHILKLIFEHDIPLDKLDQSPDERRKATKEMTLEDFMRPVPIFSHFYISSTNLGSAEPEFGLCTHPDVDAILDAVGRHIGRPNWIASLAETSSLKDAVSLMKVGEAAIAPIRAGTESGHSVPASNNSGGPEVVSALHDLIKEKTIVVFKEKAHHGWDLHMYSLINIYPALFEALKPFIGSETRLFSMNGKRIRSERSFYFETWTLANPPHGAEEVFQETTI